MQFIRKGPDVPERLLQLHEENRVVFFCGAGISYPAGLPGFWGLVKRVYDELAVTPNPTQKAAVRAGELDRAIGLLEGDIVGGRATVRKKIAEILVPDLSRRNSLRTHQALLKLATSREAKVRLVTTNFDSLFETAVAGLSLSIDSTCAPMLPVPKARWDGIVYLHGLLGSSSPRELENLVVSSGDFGLAYLQERWAARFVSELFRNFVVCFIGYSLSDPPLRYMMDALAADRLQGEAPSEVFAFDSYSKGKQAAAEASWRAKGVTPILYRMHNNHSYLHHTLWHWGATYHDGVQGRERIVAETAASLPLTSTKEDDFVGRLVWAVSDPTGLPAKRFAELNPVPPIEWLDVFSEGRFGPRDLHRFGVASTTEPTAGFEFALLDRPAPYHLAPKMALVDAVPTGTGWDDIMVHFCRWLVRHLNDPRLVVWVAKRGGRLHERFERFVDSCLQRLDSLTPEELHALQAEAPGSVPSPQMRIVWDLFLAGRVKGQEPHDVSLYRWEKRFRTSGLTAPLRMELQHLLAPVVAIRGLRGSPPHRSTESLSDVLSWEVVLTSDDVFGLVERLSAEREWRTHLPKLLPTFSLLLRDVMGLKQELGAADARNDLSYIPRPSIGDHRQNRNYHDWTALIVLARDALLLAPPDTAQRELESWWSIPFPVFKRLVFFAARREGLVAPAQAVAWLLDEGGWWLWSVETEREVVRLLVTLAPRLGEVEQQVLQEAILAGPPDTLYEGLDVDVSLLRARDVWFRLEKLRDAGATLIPDAAVELERLKGSNPDWRLATDQSDEFPYRMSDGTVGESGDVTPRNRQHLAEWLRLNPVGDSLRPDVWESRCRESFSAAAAALMQLSREGFWPDQRWSESLRVWSERKFARRSWRWLAPVVSLAENEFVTKVAFSLGWWLKEVSSFVPAVDSRFVALCHRVIVLSEERGSVRNDPVSDAINHPVGYAVQGLWTWWTAGGLADGQRVAGEVRGVLTQLLDTGSGRYRHGRVLLAAQVVTLFRVDPEWTRESLLPCFDWDISLDEAQAAWEGFLWSPRFYQPLFEELKRPFLESARHYALLGDHGRQYARVLTFVALDPRDTFGPRELAAATAVLPEEGLRECAHAVTQALEDRQADVHTYWRNRAGPYLRSIWPRSRDRVTPDLAHDIARLCMTASSCFSEAFEQMRGWIDGPSHVDYIVRTLADSDLCSEEPVASLSFLDAVVHDGAGWLTKLKVCLEKIRIAKPDASADPSYRRLEEYARRRSDD